MSLIDVHRASWALLERTVAPRPASAPTSASTIEGPTDRSLRTDGTTDATRRGEWTPYRRCCGERQHLHRGLSVCAAKTCSGASLRHCYDPEIPLQFRLVIEMASMVQAGKDTNHCRSLSQVLQLTGPLPEPAIANILLQILGYIAGTPSGCICAASVLLLEGAMTVQKVALPTDATISISADDTWAIGALALECALASQSEDPSTALKVLQGTRELTPAFLDIVATCLDTTAMPRPTLTDLCEHKFFVDHAGAAVWLRKDGRAQLQLSKKIVEAGARYLYSRLRCEDSVAVGSFLTDQSVVVVGSAITSGSAVAALGAVKKQSLGGCVAEVVSSEPALHGSPAQMCGAQASWIVSLSGVAQDGSPLSHRLQLWIRDTSIDELTVEHWEMIVPVSSNHTWVGDNKTASDGSGLISLNDDIGDPGNQTTAVWPGSMDAEDEDGVRLGESDDDDQDVYDDDSDGLESENDEYEYDCVLYKPWSALDEDEQDAALNLGWTATTWPINDRSWAPTFDDMTEEEQEWLAELGFCEEDEVWPPRRGPTPKELKTLFDKFTRTGMDGDTLRPDDLSKLWASNGLSMWYDELEANGIFDPGKSLIQNFDLDADGRVTFVEFTKLFGVQP